jgi:hypothetical protein
VLRGQFGRGVRLSLHVTVVAEAGEVVTELVLDGVSEPVDLLVVGGCVERVRRRRPDPAAQAI